MTEGAEIQEEQVKTEQCNIQQLENKSKKQ